MDDTVRINGVLAPEASLPFLSLSGGTSGVQVALAAAGANRRGDPRSGSVGVVCATPRRRERPCCSWTRTIRAAWRSSRPGGRRRAAQQLPAVHKLQQHTGLANLAIEPNIGGSNDGEVIFGYGFVNLSDRALMENVRAIPEEGAAGDLRRRGAAALRPRRRRQGADRLRGPGRAGQREAGGDDVQNEELGRPGADGFGLSKAQRGPVGVVKKLQKRVEALEKKKKRKDSD